MNGDLRAYLAKEIQRHPRVSYQGLVPHADTGQRFANALPYMPPFRDSYYNALCLVDWDHRLPSQKLALRIYAYYTEQGYLSGCQAFQARLKEIAKRDVYPEFDVPGFDNLPADEIYEADLDAAGKIGKCRLTSLWRRNISIVAANTAVEITRASSEYATVIATAKERPAHFGELEAVSWTPTCESYHACWTVDVWYLLAFSGNLGTGRSFLVDLHSRRVIKVRDFSVRTG